MKIHVLHSKKYNYKKELYSPLRNSNLNIVHEIFLPHETNKFINTKDMIMNSDIVLAEVSFASIGLGIELGWANLFKKNIICISKKGADISRSLNEVSNIFISYSDSKDLIDKIKQEIKSLKN